MRRSSLVSICVLLLAAAVCGCGSSDSGDLSDPEIRSQDDVRRFFQAVMPELVAVFTELANQQSLAASALSTKGGGGSTIPCPDGGSVNVDTSSGQASLINCSARGIVINATLALFVQPTGPSSYQADFNGILMVSGTFTGTIEVVQALIQWTDPATDANTYWEVTVLLDGQPVTVTSGDSGGNGGGNRTDNACEWDRPGEAGEVRVHVFNAFDMPQVFVQLTAPDDTTCAIEDENRTLQLPVFGNTFPDDRNTVPAGDTFGGLGQALMPLAEGDTLKIEVWSGDAMSEKSCVVSSEAFASGVPGATAGQAFIDVLGVSQPGELPTIDCGFEFVLSGGGESTVPRSGGTCDPAMEFGCDSACFEICLPEEVAQFWECGSDSVCQCTCVNYGL
jgi:hypothetical protein